ncbi:hypothetical protein V5P93_004096 [Actinokineospora auranticolor]|uniref:Peptidase inhibitor family I36 n=1 Tax=Actinokineospora auranticolor TaxID=155976 RepID=A0A2S6GDA2_9PSEU|nr:hypothetical protein [Actinokineospora auranticolor]PPK63160.1 hypothetical protein CLV40_13129 [Actinokineospora auranticolor]
MRRFPPAAVLVLVALTAILGVSAATATPAPQVAPAAHSQETLQSQVDKHLHDYGAGKQIGVNQIAFDEGRTILTLPLPGERGARAASEPVSALGTANCAYAYACIWSDTNFNGTRLSRTACDLITLAAPFNTSTGSVHNNQTNGTQTVLYNASGQILNANQALSKINDTGVGTRAYARTWRVC